VRSNFYDLIFAGIRGDGDVGQNYRSIGSDGPASILERHGVNDVPRLPRRVGVGGWLSFDGFANISGYSVISRLAMGMEPICGEAFGEKRWATLGLTLQRTVLILLCVAVPIGILWCNMEPILLLCSQDKSITSLESTYIVFSLPHLIM
jgi:hypothetical protein